MSYENLPPDERIKLRRKDVAREIRQLLDRENYWAGYYAAAGIVEWPQGVDQESFQKWLQVPFPIDLEDTAQVRIRLKLRINSNE